jgi:hypothetical protein
MLLDFLLLFHSTAVQFDDIIKVISIGCWHMAVAYIYIVCIYGPFVVAFISF